MAIYEAFVQGSITAKVPHSEVTELHVFGTAPRGSVGLAAPAGAADPTNCTCVTQNITRFASQHIVQVGSVLSVYSGNLTSTNSRAVLLNFTDNLSSRSRSGLRRPDLQSLAWSLSLGHDDFLLPCRRCAPPSGRCLFPNLEFYSEWVPNESLAGHCFHRTGWYTASTSATITTFGSEVLCNLKRPHLDADSCSCSHRALRVGVGAATTIDPLGWTAFGYLFTCSTFSEVQTSLVVESSTSTLLDSYFTALGALDPVSAYIELTDYSWLGGRLLGSLICDQIGR